jgi:hypothetical protein
MGELDSLCVSDFMLISYWRDNSLHAYILEAASWSPQYDTYDGIIKISWRRMYGWTLLNPAKLHVIHI